MDVRAVIRRATVVVDREMRKEFPEDFYKRCYYSAAAVVHIIRTAGGQAALVGGDMAGFMLTVNGRQATLQGFGGSTEGMSHVWVEASGSLIDLGFHYLPYDARRPSLPMPVATWQLADELPAYLRYAPIRSTTEAGEFVFDQPAHAARLSVFKERCWSRFNNLVGNPKPPFWFLEHRASLSAAAAAGDRWAAGAIVFETMCQSGQL